MIALVSRQALTFFISITGSPRRPQHALVPTLSSPLVAAGQPMTRALHCIPVCKGFCEVQDVWEASWVQSPMNSYA